MTGLPLVRGPQLAVVLAALVAVVMLAVVLVVGTPREDVAAAAMTVRLDAPASVPVGEPVRVGVLARGGPAPALRVTSGVATALVPVPTGGSTTAVEVPAFLTRVAGLMTLAPVGHAASAVTVEVLPGDAVDPASPLVGQRSVVVGEQRAMVTVVPTDRLGNTVAADLPVVVRVRRPGGAEDTYRTATDGMLAWAWVPPGLRAGRTVVAVEAGAARGPAADLVEVPAGPRDVVAAVEGGVPPADGRSTFTIRTDELRDAYGNLLLDGVHADVLVAGPSSRSVLAAQVVGGRVTAPVAVPDEPGVLRVVVRVDGVESAPIRVRVRRATDAVPASAEATDGRIVVRVGPVLDPWGAWLPDGTDVAVGGLAGQLVDGRAMVELEDDGRASVAVQVAGVRARIPVVRS